MTIKEMKVERLRCEQQITELLTDFTTKTGCNISDLDLNIIDVTTISSRVIPETLYCVTLNVCL